MKDLPVIKIAALIIIIAGMIFAKSIINPFLLVLFISIICVQPISWLEKIGLSSALWTLGSFLLINNVLENFVEPRIMGNGLG